ncbi:methylmalonyl-CoA mutase [Bacillus sp. FJAT-49732]|uniref:methylmalonyl-CoA mutase n=1 Tax=Lederbergia citrisecunda TaxID=2833583 RepID=A0A942TLT0_9BACI|nr:methylmalonyl-CoA mutase family protein [Lederbergia citrisecunda]MBS4199603.1 methylmalonyl-CoA mutase [Lederbergia citrisecunda]
MSIHDIKNAVFPKASYEAWEQAALKTLKSNSLEALYKETYEEIKLSPIYTKNDIDNRVEDSCFRGVFENNNWKIAQKLCSHNWDDLKRLMLEAKELGQETVSFDADHLNDIHKVDFAEINKIFNLSSTPIMIFTNYHYQSIAHQLLQMNADHVSGAVAFDIISSQLEQGYLYKQEGQSWEAWKQMISKLEAKFPSLRTILIDSTPYHNSGANAVQELAASLSEAVLVIEELRKIGWEPRKAMQKMIFHFSIGSNFFMEIAKLRAFRILWKTITSAYNVPFELCFPLISAETSNFTKSVLDAYTNILRSGNEAFAAVIGGVNFLHVKPFKSVSYPTDEFAMRIARNTQLLLREEAYLDKVIDPSGGSFYTEVLTTNLVDKAWELFQMIDKKGGIYSVLQSGWFQNIVKEVLTKRLEDIQTRKKVMIGVNAFKQDSSLPSWQKSKPVYDNPEDTVKIEPLVQVRLAEKSESGGF